MNAEALAASIRADFNALEQTTSLVYELYVRLDHLRDSTGIEEASARAKAAAGVWEQLDELGVDLRLDDLKTALTVAMVTAQPSSETGPAQPAPTEQEPAPDPEPEPAAAAPAEHPQEPVSLDTIAEALYGRA